MAVVQACEAVDLISVYTLADKQISVPVGMRQLVSFDQRLQRGAQNGVLNRVVYLFPQDKQLFLLLADAFDKLWRCFHEAVPPVSFFFQ